MKIGIVGLGLMGASFGRALHKTTNHTVYGCDINENVTLKAELLSAIDKPLTIENVGELDMLVISVYPRNFKEVAEKYLPYLKKGAILLDFCGNKRNILSCMQLLSEKYKDVVFIGGHPMAGREFSGIDHSQATLFNKASMILVPLGDDIFIKSELKQLFLSIGFEKVVITDAKTHDKNIAYTSQLCHIVSNAFIKSPTAIEHFGFSAGSYKDMTRVARMNSEMWTQLVFDNGDFVLQELDTLIENLGQYKKAIKDKNEKELNRLFNEGNSRKLQIDIGKNK